MGQVTVRKATLVWWAGGLLLGLTQILAIATSKPLGVSTEFVVVDSVGLHKVAPEYAQGHPLISNEKYQEFGYGWWFDIGLIAGAFIAAALVGRWKLRASTAWWNENHPNKVMSRFWICFAGGLLILLGARFANGCTSGQFASGWAQLSLSVVPFTVTLFGFGILAARLVYPKVPVIEK